MKLVRCDNVTCSLTLEAGPLYGNPPMGWLVVEIKGADRERHYCSAECATASLCAPDVDVEIAKATVMASLAKG